MYKIFRKFSSSKSKSEDAHRDHDRDCTRSIGVSQIDVVAASIGHSLISNYPKQREQHTASPFIPVYRKDPDRHGGRIIGFDPSSSTTGQTQFVPQVTDQDRLLRDALIRSQDQQESRQIDSFQYANAPGSKPETHKQHGGRIYDPGDYIEGVIPPRPSQQSHQAPQTQTSKRKVRYLGDW